MYGALISVGAGVSLAAFAGALPWPFALYLVVLCGLVLLGLGRTRVIFPAFWIWSPWVLALAPAATGLIYYRNPAISTEALTFIFGCNIAATLGFYMLAAGSRIPRQHFDAVQNSITAARTPITWAATAGYVSAILFTIEMMSLVNWSLSGLFDLRTQYTEREVGDLSRLVPMLAWGGWLGLMSAILGWERLPGSLRLYWIGSGVATSALSVFSAGRQAVFQLLLIAALSVAYRTAARVRRTHSRKSEQAMRTRRVGLGAKLAFASAGLAAVLYMGYVAVARNDAANQIRKLDYLVIAFAAEPDDSSYRMLRDLPYDAGSAIFEGAVYFSSGVSLFSGFYEIDEKPLYFGKFSFPWVARRLEPFSDGTVLEAMEQRRVLMRNYGYMSHGWSTALASYILDYGILGSVAFMFLTGCLGGWAWLAFTRRPSYHALALLLAVNIHFMYNILIPAASDSVFFFFVVGLFIISMFSKFYIKHPVREPRVA